MHINKVYIMTIQKVHNGTRTTEFVIRLTSA